MIIIVAGISLKCGNVNVVLDLTMMWLFQLEITTNLHVCVPRSLTTTTTGELGLGRILILVSNYISESNITIKIILHVHGCPW